MSEVNSALEHPVYNYKVVRQFAVMTVVWGIVGMLVGVLIAAQMYQESHFNPEALSHAGAAGLMQLTHTTALSLGVEDLYNPEENIRAGVQHLRNLWDYFDEARGWDRMYLALAAYNIGQGHILDARRIAEEQHLDPDKWTSISKTLPLLRFRKYHKKSIYGYCRGTEPVIYVKQIMKYYDILKRQGFEYGDAQASLTK